MAIFYAVLDDYDYVFSENGLVAHKDGKLIDTQVLLKKFYLKHSGLLLCLYMLSCCYANVLCCPFRV